MTGTIHDIVNPATTVSLAVKRHRHHAGDAERAVVAAPTISPPAASVIEFRLPSRAVGG